MEHGTLVLVHGISLGGSLDHPDIARISFASGIGSVEIEVNQCDMITRDLYDGLQCILNDRTKEVTQLRDEVEKLRDALSEEVNVNAKLNAALAEADTSNG